MALVKPVFFVDDEEDLVGGFEYGVFGSLCLVIKVSGEDVAAGCPSRWNRYLIKVDIGLDGQVIIVEVRNRYGQ